MKIIVNGAGGRMGKTLCSLIENSEKHTLAAAVSMEFDTDADNNIYKSLDEFDGEADMLIDFSNHSATFDVTSYALKKAMPVVIATTGQNEEEMAMIKSASAEIPVFY